MLHREKERERESVCVFEGERERGGDGVHKSSGTEQVAIDRCCRARMVA